MAQGAPPLGLAIFPLILTLSAFISSSTRGFVGATVALPEGFETGLVVLKVFAPLFSVIIVATTVGAEYSQDTWKSVLIRAPGRAGFLLAKLVVSCLSFFGATLIALTLYFGCLLVSARILQLPPPKASIDVVRACGFLGFIFLNYFFYAVASLLAAVASRSQTGTVFIALLGLPIFAMAAARTRFLSWTLPGIHLLNLEARWRYGGENKELQLNFGRAVSASESALVVLLFCALCTGIAVQLFRRRDVA